MVLAVLAAIAMWIVVNRGDQVEAQLEVNLNYLDIPPDLIVTKGLISSISVRVRGPKTLMRALPSERISDAISLGSIKAGENTIPLPSGDLSLYPKLRSFTIVDIQPPRLEIYAEPLVERKVRVETILESPVKPGALVAEEVGVDPPTVTLRGPENTLKEYPFITLRIPLDASKPNGDTFLTLDTPNFVTAEPNRVRVRYKITSNNVQLTRACKVAIALNGANEQYEIKPPTVDVTVEVPESLEKSENFLQKLRLSVLPPDMRPGESRKLKIRTSLPDGMSLISLSEPEVTVTHK